MPGSAHKGKTHYFPQHHIDNDVFLYLTTVHANLVLQWEKFEPRLLKENKFMRRELLSPSTNALEILRKASQTFCRSIKKVIQKKCILHKKY